MPSSSRRKQSKPQHLSNDSVSEGILTTEENCIGRNLQNAPKGVKVNNMDLCNGSGGSFTYDEDDDENNMEETLTVAEAGKQNQEEHGDSQPEDLSTKVRVTVSNLASSRSYSKNSKGSSPEGDSGQSCIHCDFTAETKDTFEQHLPQHSKESKLQCQKCSSEFESSAHLQHHMFMVHSILHPENNSSIAQQKSPSRKRLFHEIQALTDESQSNKSSSPSHHDITSSSLVSNLLHSRDIASKPPRLETSSLNLSANSAISPHLALLDMSMKKLQSPPTSNSPDKLGINNLSKSPDVHRLTESLSKHSGTELAEAHICHVCSKLFPKPSDLKRHMMCHTGEKPFRCEYCSKPFRAKSSMHYHLKATHGIDIELSPGLEERYLRMKTRAQMNLLQKGHLVGLSLHYGSEKDYSRNSRDSHDVDDLDDEQSLEPFYQNSGNGSDLRSEPQSQGFSCQTGSDSKLALDLSTAGNGKGLDITEDVLVYEKTPTKRGKLSIHNETILVTRLDGMDIEHGESTSLFKCHLCLKTCMSLGDLRKHLSFHDKQKTYEYICCFCDDKFDSKMQIQTHVRRQHSLVMAQFGLSDDGDFACKFCVKRYGSKDSLLKHARLHIIHRSYCCQVCGKTFSQYTSLQIHISRRHSKSELNSKRLSWVRRKLSFLYVKRYTPRLQDCVVRANDEPLNLVSRKDHQNLTEISNQNVTIVMPKSPPRMEESDAGFSQHSFENEWLESDSNIQGNEVEESDTEIRSAPQRLLLPHRRELSPKGRACKPSPLPAYHSQLGPDNDEPLNFSKAERNPENGTSESSDSSLPNAAVNSVAVLPDYSVNTTNHILMAKALAAHQTLTNRLSNTSQPMIFPSTHLPPSLAAMTQMMSLPGMSGLVHEAKAGTSKSPSPASHSSSKSDTSPEDRDCKEGVRESLLGYPGVQWGPDKSSLWSFNMYSPSDTGHVDGRKVTSLSRTHSRLGIVQAPINRETICKPTTLTDGRTVYKCPFCSKEFVSYTDINRHMDFHEGKAKDIRPYKCHFCDYYARTNSQLKVHMMRHQGIREFCCKLCNYKGVTQSDLNRHMKSQIHTLKSRNACSFCGEGFVTSKNLEKHLDGNCIVKMQKMSGGLELPLQERVT